MSEKENILEARVESESNSASACTHSKLGKCHLLRRPGQALLGRINSLFGTLGTPPRPWCTAIIVILLLTAGFFVRVWTFRCTAPIRYFGDAHNAWVKGSAALLLGDGDFFAGIVELYRCKNDANINYPLLRRFIPIDYPPLRIYLKTAWVRYIRNRHGSTVDHLDRTMHPRLDGVLYPMLTVNFCFELLAAIGMYRLCRLFRGPRLSLLAACCLWFNPAVIYNTFGWPQWDIWVIPPVIWATWATLRRGGFASNLLADFFAGICLGLGAMLKGQILLAALWFPLIAAGRSLLDSGQERGTLNSSLPPHLFALRQAALRLCMQAAGFVLAVGVITLPFTLRGSLDWLDIYRSKAVEVLPMAMSAWNLPHLLATHYHWSSTSPVTLAIPGFSLTLPVMQWLKYLFVGWLVGVVMVSMRARKQPQVLLAVGTIFTVAFAVLPGMHERYALWGAALLAVGVCVGRSPAIVHLAITGLALACQLRVGLSRDLSFAPRLKGLLDMAGTNASWLWLASALWLTWLMGRTPATKKAPRSDVQSPARDRSKMNTANSPA